ncbi:MAG: CocE/NonD family hydrolase, partial [Gemmatimonadota bacterium]
MRIPNKKIAMHCAVVIILSTLMVSCDDDDITGNDDPFRSGSTESFYLAMPDGVRLALDVTIPQPLGAGVQVPTIVTMTRYWRGDEGGGGMSDIFDWRKEAAARRGYAFVVIDERGTGASFGVWPYPWSEASLEDFAAVVDWVVAQEWSDGQVGAWGISYLGMAAQHLAALNHTAVKAAVPTFTQYDLYTDLVYPGGIFLDTYMRDWHEA